MSDDGSLLEARDPFLGKVVAGKYVIDGFLGAGAMGRVYRATQRPLDKVVAVKVLHANFGGDQVTLQRFLREAKAASRFDHPNSVTVFDFGIEPDGTAYIVMEYLRGESLEDLIQREGTLAAPRCVAIMSQVLAALSEAHDAGIVHRDLKPENIMLVSRGGEDFAGETVKVADFGIAKMLGDDDPRTAAKITATGIISGSPAYMSPEQAQALPVDGRSDLYQCGVILYEMITGEIPFFANNAIGVIMQHISQPAPSARLRNPACPEVLDALIAKAMAKAPERRFSNARAMRQALKLVAPDQVTPTANVALQSTPKPLVAPRPAAAANVTETLPETSAVESPTPKPPPPAPRRRFVQVAAMVSGAVALAAVVVAISPRAERSAPSAQLARPVPVAAVVDSGAPVREAIAPPARSEDGGAPAAPAAAVVIAEASPPEREATAQARARTRGGSRAVAPVVAVAEPVRQTEAPPAVIEPPPSTPVVAPVVVPPVVVAPAVAAAAAPLPAVAPPPPVPTLRGVRGSLGSMQVSGGLTRGAIQGRATQAADALARCVQRAAESRGGAAAFGSSATVSAVVAVRDRRADEARLSGGGALVGGCRDAVLGAFRGDLPQAEDTEYEVRMTIALEPQF